VNPSSPIVLASGSLTRSGDTVSIELHQPLDHPSFVMVVWPQKSSVTAATPKAFVPGHGKVPTGGQIAVPAGGH